MKKFLKISTAMVALVLALACFAACSNGIDDNNANTDTGNKGNGDVAVVKTLSDEWNAIVEGGTLKFSFYTDNTFEYKESVNGKIGEISGTYAIDNARAVAYGKYRLTIEKKSGQFSYATDFTEGGTMSVTISDNSLTVDGINEVFENMYIVEGPWFEVTSFDDLVGTWVTRDIDNGENNTYLKDFLEEGKNFDVKHVWEFDWILEWQIDNNNNYKSFEKAGSWEKDTFIFSTSITDEQVTIIQARESGSTPDEYYRETFTVTNDKMIRNAEQIKDAGIGPYPLKLENGKCYGYDGDDDKLHYIKINKAKNGLQIYQTFENKEEDRFLYTLKRQQ